MHTASVKASFDEDGRIANLGIAEQWTPIERGTVPAIIALCEAPAKRFVSAAEDAALEAIGDVR
jgi:hypothetical protein